jgi:hypothetical protein
MPNEIMEQKKVKIEWNAYYKAKKGNQQELIMISCSGQLSLADKNIWTYYEDRGEKWKFEREREREREITDQSIKN